MKNMANILLNYMFSFAFSILNFVSPSIMADILLHPFDFATVLLQIGYDPQGIKSEGASLMSVIVQYALFTFYIPYILTSMQGLQFMGMPHPSVIGYVSYIYKKEGLFGCYRGLVPKICERLIMVTVNDRVKRKFNRDSNAVSSEELIQENFVQSLINSICSQFFAVLASHPFHVLMVSSFAEFTLCKKSSLLQLSRSIFEEDGYFGFFVGLSARLFGELLSLTFSLTYTAIINRQLRRPRSVREEIQPSEPSERRAAEIVNYVSDISRFTALKQDNPVRQVFVDSTEEEGPGQEKKGPPFRSSIPFDLMGRTVQSSSPRSGQERRPGTTNLILDYIPLTSKLFYYIMIRDFLSKRVSNPFYLVCHCAIVLETGWDKFPLSSYFHSLAVSMQTHLQPSRRNRLPKRKKYNLNAYRL